MSLIKRMRKQKAVLWSYLKTDRKGMPVYDDPVEIDCRWVNTGMLYRDSNGEEKMSASLAYADRVPPLKSLMWLGELADAPADPRADNTVFEVKRVDEVPNFKATEYLIRVYL